VPQEIGGDRGRHDEAGKKKEQAGDLCLRHGNDEENRRLLLRTDAADPKTDRLGVAGIRDRTSRSG
jgi:hypothetical protein